MAWVACNHPGDKQLRLDSNTRCLALSNQAAAGRKYTLGLVDVSCDTRETVLVLSSPVTWKWRDSPKVGVPPTHSD